MAAAPAIATTMTTAADTLPGLRRLGRLRWLAPWLMLCLLLAQQAGLTHRVLHGGGLSPWAATVLARAESADRAGDSGHGHDTLSQSAHSCVLFDGATLDAGPCGAPTMPVLSHALPFVPPGITWRWPHLPAQRAFLTRAPPVSPAFA